MQTTNGMCMQFRPIHRSFLYSYLPYYCSEYPLIYGTFQAGCLRAIREKWENGEKTY